MTGHKKIRGRQRHVLVDTHGHLLQVIVHAANIHDSRGGQLVMDAVREPFGSLRPLWVDNGYQGRYWHGLQIDRGLKANIVARRGPRAVGRSVVYPLEAPVQRLAAMGRCAHLRVARPLPPLQ